ncbi:hypothetical protein C3L33_12957, partial [Rhododendron williamsianum]
MLAGSFAVHQDEGNADFPVNVLDMISFDLSLISIFSVFYRCEFKQKGALIARGECQLYRECKIQGASDLVFGNAHTILQRVTLIVSEGIPAFDSVAHTPDRIVTIPPQPTLRVALEATAAALEEEEEEAAAPPPPIRTLKLKVKFSGVVVGGGFEVDEGDGGADGFKDTSGGGDGGGGGSVHDLVGGFVEWVAVSIGLDGDWDGLVWRGG